MLKLPEIFFCEETRCGYHITRDRKKLWAVLLNLAAEVKRICEKYNIRYYLHTGSLLGAVRHNGFIPWDDDIDFLIRREDFSKFSEAAEKEIAPPFFWQTPENSGDIYNNGRYLLRMDGTTGVQCIRSLHCQAHQGIAVDILILDNSTDDAKALKKQRKMLDVQSGMMFFRKYGIGARKDCSARWSFIQALCLYIMSEFVSEEKTLKRFDKACTMFCDKPCGYKAVYQENLGLYRHKILPASAYDDSVYMDFEGISFPVPSGYDDVLRIYYGDDYMSFPPEENRKGHHFPILYTDKDYKAVLNHFQNTMSIEKNKQVIVFGAGKMLEHYLKHILSKYHPVFVVDNDSSKWGSKVHGIAISSPERINDIPPDRRHIIICSIYYKQIAAQLEDNGISEYYIYIQNPNWL